MLCLKTEDFVHPYLGRIDIEAKSKFILLTGANGAGKTQFLAAIKNQQVKVGNLEGGEISPFRAEYFDWKSTELRDNAIYTSGTIGSARAKYSKYIACVDILDAAVTEIFKSSLSTLGVTSREGLIKAFDHYSSTVEIWREQNSVGKFRQALSDLYDGQGPLAEMDYEKCRNLSLSEFSLTETNFRNPYLFPWWNSALFTTNVGTAFARYRDAWIDYLVEAVRRSPDPNRPAVPTRAEFEKIFGPPPWEVIHNVFSAFELPYEFEPLDMNDLSGFKPTLRRHQTGEVVPFSDLSSGEAIAVNIAIAISRAEDSRTRSGLPGILCLDEVDALLHPSLIKKFLFMVIEVLVGKFGINVIAATHSPTTVALAPEESIFLMEAGKVRKVTKNEALNHLTVGVPTLAVSFDGRRQVLVEAPVDAYIYGSLFNLIKGDLCTERSLEFLAAGKDAGRGNGCAQVISLVQALEAAGNLTAYGLVDWDGGDNTPTSRIAVLAENGRDGIENILLDPLIIALVLLEDRLPEAADIGFHGVSWNEFAGYGEALLQQAANAVARKIFGSDGSEFEASEYMGGVTLSIDKRCFVTDDHRYYELVLAAFPSLERFARKKGGMVGGLLKHVVDKILFGNRKFVPMGIVNAFKDLLTR